MVTRKAPQRIVCLTEETTETLYLLGEGERVVGVSAYTERPPEAKEKPAVSAFVTARTDKILALQPDLVLTFSDLQADICAELVRAGLQVIAFNQRSVEGILDMVSLLSRIVDRPRQGDRLVQALEDQLQAVATSAARFSRRPTVFFEEWPEPLISGIQWVEELVELAGGQAIFPELREKGQAADRTVSPQGVIDRNPDVILASWCGRRFDPAVVRARNGWEQIPAVRDGYLYELDPSTILQPGPAALTDGVWGIHELLAGVVGVVVDPASLRLPLEQGDAARS